MKMKTIYGIENFKKFIAENNLSDTVSNYDKERFEEDELRYAGLTPVCEIVQAFCFYENDEQDAAERGYSYYLNHISTVALYKGEHLRILGNYNDKTFYFRLCDAIGDSYLRGFSDRCLAETPAKVGKATEGKMNAWVAYLKSIEAQKKENIEKVTAKVNDFRKSLSDYEDIIRWNKGRTSGSIVRGGMEYVFSIDDWGYISQEVKKHYKVDNSLSSFLLISENKY